MHAYRGGTTVELGRYPVTIAATSAQELDLLRQFACRAVGRLPEPRPNLILPHTGTTIILSYQDPVDPGVALSQFKEALHDCQAEA